MAVSVKEGKAVPRLEGYGDFTSPENKSGLAMNFVDNGKAVTGSFTVPSTMGAWRTDSFVAAHPGIVDTALSTVMGHAACHRLSQVVLIRSMSVQYISFVPVETEVHCQATIRGQRHDEIVMDGEITDASGKVLAHAQGTFWIVPGAVLRGEPAIDGRLVSSRLACGNRFAAEFEKVMAR